MTRILRIHHLALVALVAFTLSVSGCFVEDTINDFNDTVGFDSYFQLGYNPTILESDSEYLIQNGLDNFGFLEGIPIQLIGPHRSTAIPVQVEIVEISPIQGEYESGESYEAPLIEGQHFSVSDLNVTIAPNSSHTYIEWFESFCLPWDVPYGASGSVVLEVTGVGADDVEIGEFFKQFTVTIARDGGNMSPNNSPARRTMAAGCDSNNPPFFTTDPPMMAPSGNVQVSVGTEYVYNMQIRDPEQFTEGYDFANTVSISAPVLPSWLTFSDDGLNSSPVNRNRLASVEGTPSAADVGTHEVVIVADDGAFTTEHRFTIVVVE